MLAVREGHSSIVEVLLKEPGIDVTQRDVNGSIALHLACRYGGCDLSEVMTINVQNTSKEALEKMIYFL